LLRPDFRIGNSTPIPLVAFAQVPMDSRSACIAVLATNHDPRTSVEQCKSLGAPIVLVCARDTLQWWKQGSEAAEWIESVPSDRLERFFRSHQTDFSPEAVYRAKTLGRIRSEYQLSFVDLGLMPLVEEEVGKELNRLIERNVSDIKKRLGWTEISDDQGHWLLKSVFWLVSGKILRDKQVPNFEDLDLVNVDDVFRRVAKHYGSQAFAAGSKPKLAALRESASVISQFSSLALATTESLAYVYENTLISKATRAALGTHSTPSWLVDYIVGSLADWIEEIPENERNVFEPACGHSAFLVSAMRLLTQLLPEEKAIPSRRGPYLRSRLHGTDRDPFALELARLSLTLTDIPNPDGWDLRAEDMFLGNRLAEQTRGKTILLANPPFEDFGRDELAAYAKTGNQIAVHNKATEMLRRTLPHLQPGGVFGLVLPQTILHAAYAQDVRRYLMEHFELREISLFPDKVFSFSDAESAVLLGRRFPDNAHRRRPITFRRIREQQMPIFRQSYDAPSSRKVEQSRFNATNRWDMRVPDLEEVWVALAAIPRANDLAEFGTGLVYHGKDLPQGIQTYSEHRFQGAIEGYIRLERGLKLHQLPKLFWMNLADSAILRRRAGTTTGVPQVLMNHARVSRGPWRLKAFVDNKGRPVSGSFNTARPKSYSLEALWALLNSPIANAYAFCHLSKRHNLVGDIKNIPMPKRDRLGDIEAAAREYLEEAIERGRPNELCKLMQRVDAAVLRQYELPVQLEWELLSLFNGWERVGVPFKQDRFFPAALIHPIHYSDFITYESDWPRTNRRRGQLVDKEISGTITDAESTELAGLQAYADYYLEKVSPRPTELLEKLERHILQSGKIETKGS
jgi:N-6 DNA Methylase